MRDQKTVAEEFRRAPEAIFYNGKVVTVDAAFHIQQAFAIARGNFVAVGTDAEIKPLAGKETQMIDLHGATVAPGFTDAHDHLFPSGKYMYRGVDMVGVTSMAEMQSRLRKAVETAKPGEVVFSTLGWTIRPAPTRKDLDAVSAEIPIILNGSRRAIGVYNSAALRLAGISKENPSFDGKPFPVDASGEFTGAFPGYPAALVLLDKLLPPLSSADKEDIILRGFSERHALGITSIRELSVWPDAVQSYYRVWRQGKMTLRVALGLEFPDCANTGRHLEVMGVAVPFGDHWLRMDSQSEEPWPPAMAQEPFTELMLTLNRLGWRAAPHVGPDSIRGTSFDDATNAALDAYEAADRVSPLKGKRWYIEHVSFSTPEQIDRMVKLGLIVSVQDFGYYGPHPKAPPEKERRDHQNPVRSFLDKGLVVIGGSDWRGPEAEKTNPNNPLINFYLYVTRKARDGSLCAPEEKISREQALRIFTINPAYATFEEEVKGSIEPGKLADFVILSQDLMTVPDDKILETKVLATFVDGKKVYSTPDSRF